MKLRGRPQGEHSFAVMALLAERGPMTAREIAAFTRRTMPQTRTVLRNLKRQRQIVVVDRSPVEGRTPVSVYAVARMRRT
jgi:predicted ArsR family transcriptional regulator